MIIIGLTGNIACGKTEVAHVLRELGAEVLDSDALVHQAYQAGTEVSEQVAREFGPHVMRQDGSVNRAALGNLVFGAPDNLRRLEAIVWPAVARMRDQWLQGCAVEVVVVDAVKLIESGFAGRCDQVWVVTAPPELQRRRLIEQRGVSPDRADQRLAAQTPVAPKLAVADVVLDNSGTRDELRAQVLAAWRRLVPAEGGGK